MSTVTVTVKQRTTEQGDRFEGTVALQGAKPTKLTRKDGTTLFPTTSALKSSARAFGQRLGLEVSYDEPVKQAAKKSVKSKTTTAKAKKSIKPTTTATKTSKPTTTKAKTSKTSKPTTAKSKSKKK